MKRIALGRTVRGIAIVGGLLLGGLGTIYAVGGHGHRVKQDLSATSMAPAAHGKASLVLRGSKHGKFNVLAKHLAGDKQFDLIVGGVKVGSLSTNGGGSGRARFSTQPGSKDTVLGFDPRGARVIVRDEDGDDVLVGDMPNDDDGSTVACCISQGDDEDGVGNAECEEMTPEECQQEGGTPIGVPGGTAASCLPNPCATTPPGPPVICCKNQTHDDENEAECEAVATQAECADNDGMVVSATSCDPNPCAVTPPANRTACCIAEQGDGDPGETECEVLSAETCMEEGGTPNSAISCEPDPCGGGGGGGGGDDGGGDGD
jgi:hypothetical protein